MVFHACFRLLTKFCFARAVLKPPLLMRQNNILPAWVMVQLTGENCYNFLASLPVAERNRFLQRVQANPAFEGVVPLSEAPVVTASQPLTKRVLHPLCPLRLRRPQLLRRTLRTLWPQKATRFPRPRWRFTARGRSVPPPSGVVP